MTFKGKAVRRSWFNTNKQPVDLGEQQQREHATQSWSHCWCCCWLVVEAVLLLLCLLVVLTHIRRTLDTYIKTLEVKICILNVIYILVLRTQERSYGFLAI